MQGQSRNNEWEEYNNSSHNDVGETADDATEEGNYANRRNHAHVDTGVEGDDSFSPANRRIESQG